MRMLFVAVFVALLGVTLRPSAAQSPKKDEQELARKVYDLFEKSCFVCHGKGGQGEGNFDYILDHQKLVASKVTAGKPDKSRLFKRLGIARDMPPTPDEDDRAKGLPRPTEDDIALVKKWIESGAPPWVLEVEKPRVAVTLLDELKAMRDFLRKANRDDRPYLRFFTFGNLHNIPASQVSSSTMRLYRGALSKLVNSLSLKHTIVLPRAVDAQETVYVVDIRKLDWDRKSLWNEILKLYPYGLTHERYPDDGNLNEIAQDLYELAGTTVPVVRADWFIATASRPPLYHTLLQIPDCAEDLERALKVDLADNFYRGQLARAGFIQSGVSSQNRLVERHEALHGAYWKSYDFKSGAGKGNLFVFPLGPVFARNPFVQHAFKQDGGEIIFNLPNGLQGYMLVDGKDRRIDAGPIEVVSDGKKTSGTNLVVNGISCMACHNEGMREDFKDQVRDSHNVGGMARDKVRELYPPSKEMNALLARDKKRFLAATEEAMAPFLKVGPDAKKDITDFPEAISAIAGGYPIKELAPADLVRELGTELGRLQGAIEANELLRRQGLSPVGKNHAIKREIWENRDFGASAFQEASRVLKLGTPVNPH